MLSREDEVLRHRLRTGEIMGFRRVRERQGFEGCRFCTCPEESVAHIFLVCPHAILVVTRRGHNITVDIFTKHPPNVVNAYREVIALMQATTSILLM